MNLLRMEKRDRGIARALGIEAANRGKAAESVLDNAEMRTLCAGYGAPGVKMLVGDFLAGHSVQQKVRRRVVLEALED